MTKKFHEVYKVKEFNDNCPECGNKLVPRFRDHWFPTGASGEGVWTFRKVSLFHCITCREEFSIVDDPVRTNRIKEEDKDL